MLGWDGGTGDGSEYYARGAASRGRAKHNRATGCQTHSKAGLSIALRHNFFSDLARQLDAATEGKLEQQHTALQQLQADYERLKEERDYLRKALDLISK